VKEQGKNKLLMNSVVHSCMVMSLDKFWRNQDIVYDFRAQLQGTRSRSEVLYE